MIELGELEAHQADFAQRNTRIVAVSVDSRDDAKKTQTAFPHLIVVADRERKLSAAVDVLYHSAADGKDLVAPTTILIDRDGVVRWLYRPERYLARLSPADLLAAVDTYLRVVDKYLATAR